jgi:antitoxin ParD1/3/4
MSAVEKLSIALTPQLAQKAREIVASGDYATTSEVIREGLRLLIERRERLAQLRAEIQKGFDSGPAEPRRPIEEMLAAGRARLAQRRGA